MDGMNGLRRIMLLLVVSILKGNIKYYNIKMINN